MTTTRMEILQLKWAAEWAAAKPSNETTSVVYRIMVPPTDVLELIAEIERHRQVNAEGCKPDSNTLLCGVPCTNATPCRSLDKAEGDMPDLINPSHDLNAACAWLEAARRNLNSAVEHAYPIGSKLMVDRGTHHAHVEVVCHPNVAHPGTISVQNIKTGKRYRIDYSRVLEERHD
ncbi:MULTISPECIES: hypothetical protein [Pseudomonas]|uniref:hypothetical protein n=1 Tax=Pseudomonas TaxID=286 RepID=UPI001AE92E61|nr:MULTISPECIES: hypothetical protein [Pseudomonas]MBP2081634.1 hypothetical protein [Pseudomonas sp. PvP089]MBP2086749.1 hypothetical protein [Pseudomonas sp. PvP088]MBP2221090.1 hypothetical protein [Pseudomonas putida]